jgi:hypothetical protein
MKPDPTREGEMAFLGRFYMRLGAGKNPTVSGMKFSPSAEARRPGKANNPSQNHEQVRNEATNEHNLPEDE